MTIRTGSFVTMTPGTVKLSIIVPVYRVEAYLPRCLDSLLAQTLEDIEIVCVNDGSPDRCLDILRDYQRRLGDKIVVVDKPNEGVWRARLDGIAVARGEYLGFLDSDDWAEPTFAETLYRTATRTGADVTVCGYERTDLATGKVLSRELCDEREPFSIDEDPGRLVGLNTAVWNKCFRAEALRSLPDLDEAPAVLEDVAFHLLAYLGLHGRVAFAPEPLVHYMVRADSAINTVRDEQVDSILATFLQVRGRYEDGRPELLPMLDLMAFLHLGVSLVFRLSSDAACDLRAMISRITAYLDRHFPTWSSSPYLERAYVRSAGGALRRLRLARAVYRAGLMPAALGAYRLLIERLHVDVKW